MTLKLREGGNFLRNRRKSLGLTIEEVKKETGLEVSDISRLENGRVTSPSLDKAVTYGTYLGMTPNEIAVAYGLWVSPSSGRLSAMSHQMQRLPKEEMERLLEMMEALVRSAVHEQITRQRSN